MYSNRPTQTSFRTQTIYLICQNSVIIGDLDLRLYQFTKSSLARI